VIVVGTALDGWSAVTDIVVDIRTAQNGRARFKVEGDVGFDDDDPTTVNRGCDPDDTAASPAAGINRRVECVGVEGFAIALLPILLWIEDLCAIGVRLGERECREGGPRRPRPRLARPEASCDRRRLRLEQFKSSVTIHLPGAAKNLAFANPLGLMNEIRIRL
jgi:hypothetical protein